MARNGSGTYNLLTNSWNPATNGVSATAVDWQNLINDVASALTQSLSADGQTPMTGNLNAGVFLAASNYCRVRSKSGDFLFPSQEIQKSSNSIEKPIKTA